MFSAIFLGVELIAMRSQRGNQVITNHQVSTGINQMKSNGYEKQSTLNYMAIDHLPNR